MYDDIENTPFPVLDTKPATILASAGDTVLLPCSVTNLGSHSISWMTSRYEPLTLNDQVVIDDDVRLSVNVIDNTEWNLLIENVEGADSGKYVCMVQTMPPQTKPVELTVTEPPSILENSFQPIIELTEGKPLTVSCITKGVPKPKVDWFIKKTLPNGSQQRELYQGGHLLTINAVRRTDSGTYICEAINERGRIDREMQLIINYEPTITMSTVPIPVKEGSDAVMSCSAEGKPAPQIMWLRFNYRLGDSNKHKVQVYASSEIARKAVLTVINTTKEDAGRYRCLARNKVGHIDEFVRIAVILSTSTSTTTTITTTPALAIETTTEEFKTNGPRRTSPPLKPDDLIRSTKEPETTLKVIYNTPKTGETKNSSCRNHANFVTLLVMFILTCLYKLS